ncbi:MAG: DUF4398 domain-containing protein [Xanthomonadaceae bacterium]|nr:DUF4398 domain-containing protein [Xanthomonadaceae bacterium]
MIQNKSPIFPTHPAVLAGLLALFVAGCATTPPDPALLLEAEEAIELAERAEAQRHASLELAEARELYATAQALIAQDEAEAATRMAERTTLQARLAVARSRGAILRAELNLKRDELQRLEADLRDSFGDAIEVQP